MLQKFNFGACVILQTIHDKVSVGELIDHILIILSVDFA